LNGQTLREGVVTPAIKILDPGGKTIDEVHGQPMLPRPVAPGQSLRIQIPCRAPSQSGRYLAKIDLVDQKVCWFEDRGSQPLVFSFEVI